MQIIHYANATKNARYLLFDTICSTVGRRHV